MVHIHKNYHCRFSLKSGEHPLKFIQSKKKLTKSKKNSIKILMDLDTIIFNI